MSKLVSSLREAIAASGLRDGMTVSFHHHLRSGDYVINMVMNEIAAMGIKNLTVNASSLFDVHAPLAEHIKSGVITRIITDYMSEGLGKYISAGIMEQPVEFMTHGGRPTAIMQGKTPIDVAFVAAPAADCEGNCTGKIGRSACGSRDPVGLIMARDAADVIKYSGLLKDGFSFQTGAGGASLAAAKFLMEIMLEEKIHGGFGLGGITGYMVDMLRAGCFEELRDVQCFDLKAVESIRTDPRHHEISAFEYASPANGHAWVNSLDAVILGATEIDTEFNVNVHTNSSGTIMGGSGGHSDTAAGAKLAMVIAPLFRARQPIITERVSCVSTPGRDIDVFVTQYGIAVNPKNEELRDRLIRAHLPIVSIEELKAKAESLCGVPKALEHGDKIAAKVIGRDGEVQDLIYCKK